MNTHHPDRLTDAAGVRVLLYGDVDLNVIDGSATWLPSLAETLGAQTGEDGRLVVDPHQQTTVPGLYAAGDVVRGLNQIVVASAEAAVAATDIHNRLREADGQTV